MTIYKNISEDITFRKNVLEKRAKLSIFHKRAAFCKNEKFYFSKKTAAKFSEKLKFILRQ